MSLYLLCATPPCTSGCQLTVSGAAHTVYSLEEQVGRERKCEFNNKEEVRGQEADLTFDLQAGLEQSLV